MRQLEDVKPTNSAEYFEADSEMIRPPVNRLMKVLDRSFFQKSQRVCVAQIFDPKDIATIQAELKCDLLRLGRVRNVVSISEHDRQTKALILRPGIKNEGTFRIADDAKRHVVLSKTLTAWFR